MNRHRTAARLAASLLALCAAAGIAFAADPAATLTVDPGAGAAPIHWSVAQLKQQLASQCKPVDYDSHGQHHSSTCIPLLAILQSAGVPTQIKMDPTADPKTKHRPLRMAILVSAADGYAVCFSLAELLPEIGNRPAWVALDQDGSPLRPSDQPLKLIVPDDAKPARWIHAVDHITVIDLAAHPTTAPAP